MRKKFNEWYQAEACLHSRWVKKREYTSKKTMIKSASDYNAKNYPKTICLQCVHAGQHTEPVSRVKKARTTLKVNCPATIDVNYMLDETVKVTNKLAHKGHDKLLPAAPLAVGEMPVAAPAASVVAAEKILIDDDVQPVQQIEGK